jgi:hypothetical protein
VARLAAGAQLGVLIEGDRTVVGRWRPAFPPLAHLPGRVMAVVWYRQASQAIHTVDDASVATVQPSAVPSSTTFMASPASR